MKKKNTKKKKTGKKKSPLARIYLLERKNRKLEREIERKNKKLKEEIEGIKWRLGYMDERERERDIDPVLG